jgi:alkanesulfonate monooxygenase SsuD/methylene tetrahydromethanopterin reductase-like flavin-dependent oxidoreductase (luciferase family)
VKRIGFLSFGHWAPSPQSQVRTAADALLQSIELAAAAEELGADGAYFRVHHFARQLGSPFPLLAAVGLPPSTNILVFDAMRNSVRCASTGARST